MKPSNLPEISQGITWTGAVGSFVGAIKSIDLLTVVGALVAVCGFRESCNLASGRHIHIDDIVTLPQSRRKGYASRLLAEVRKIGAETGVTKIHLNVHVNHDRVDAHRLYFKNGFEICAYHFRCDPK